MLAMICCALFLPSPAYAVDIFATIDRAMGLLQNGELDGAQDILTTAQADGCDDPLLSSAQGVFAMYTSNYGSAEAIFRSTLLRDPKQLAALWGVSLCLLARNRVNEAATFIERAAEVAPTDTRVKTLQAYIAMLLDRLSDAAVLGKGALDGGEKSAFLMATLAQIYSRMGYEPKALEFGSFAAKSFYGMNFLAPNQHVALPLTMQIADDPQMATPALPAPAAHGMRTALELEVPKTLSQPSTDKIIHLVSPIAGTTVYGMQQIRAVYHGSREIKFVIFLVDHVIRGMMTDFPFHFDWDANGAQPGEHQLCVRAFDYHGVLLGEDTLVITSATGQPRAPATTSVQISNMQARLLTLTMPDAQPLALFANLGKWHLKVHETAQAVGAFEKAAAINPRADGILPALAQLYQENGLHSLSASRLIYHGTATGNKKIALTFDDGPNPLYTPSIISELKKYNAHATFFLVGKMVQLFPDLVMQVLAEGHELANHTYTHPNLTKLTNDDIIAEVLRTRAVIKEITGKDTYLFRPPGGDIDAKVADQLHALDYNIIYWDVNIGEFRKHPPQEQAAMVLNKAKDGSIILMHNGLIDGTLNILPTLLDELHKRGFNFVTVSELLRDNVVSSR